jgi:hypothetical protein
MASHRRDHADRPGHVPADQPDDHDVRPRRGLGQGVALGEGEVVHPAVVLHDHAVHLRQDRDAAAHAQQREAEEADDELPEIVVLAHRRSSLQAK